MRCVTGKEEGFNEGFGVSGGDLGGGIFWSEGLVFKGGRNEMGRV